MLTSLRHNLFILLFLFLPLLVVAQGSSCGTLEPFCAGGEELVFANSNPQNSSIAFAEPGPDYGCLFEQPYPAWFYLQIENDGDLEFRISQFENRDGSGLQIDVDFVVWGPFNRNEEYCDNSQLSAANIIDCSFEPFAVEEMSIPGAQSGEVYIVIITNYDAIPGFISLQQTNANAGDAGSTDCSIIDGLLGEDRILCGETETVLDATFEGITEYEWYIFNENIEEFVQIPGQTGPELSVTSSGRYQVVVIDYEANNTDSDEIEIQFFDTPEIFEPESSLVCGGFPQNLNLREWDEEISGSQENVIVEYYTTDQNAIAGEAITDPANFQISEETRIFARVIDSQSLCASEVISLDFTESLLPEDVLSPQTIICLDPDGNLAENIQVGEDLGADFEYTWLGDGSIISNTALLEINNLPAYREIVLEILTDSGCVVEFSTSLVFSAPPQSVEISKEGSDFSGGYTLTASLDPGVGDAVEYQYRLDNGAWQASEVFRNVQQGWHRISARDVNACGETTSEEIYLFGYPRFFTPNNDGYNDSWRISNNEDIQVLEIFIFDRYGKLLKHIPAGGAGWDGTFNGRDMPSNDYWFKLIFVDLRDGSQQEFSGNFSLKR
ncbi:T9SS type B sorting domain-containing protein [Salegentibacter sp. HM20]